MNVEQMIQDVVDGNENPLRAYALLKEKQKDIQEAIKHIEEYAIEEAEKHGEKIFETMDWKFEMRNGARRCVYKNIPEWVEANKALKDRESLYKQAALAYEKGKTIVDENGEVVPAAETTFAKSSLIIKRL